MVFVVVLSRKLASRHEEASAGVFVYANEVSRGVAGCRRMSPDLAVFLGANSELPRTEFRSKCGGFQTPRDVCLLLPGIELPLQYQKPQECSCPGSNCPRIPCMLLACEEVNMLESEEGHPDSNQGPFDF